MTVTIVEIIAAVERRLTRNSRSAAALRLTVWFSYSLLLSLVLCLLSFAAGLAVFAAAAAAIAVAAWRKGMMRRAGLLKAAAALDAHLGSKNRLVSYLKVCDGGERDQEKELLESQVLERVPADFSAECFRLALPRPLRFACCSLPVVYVLLGVTLFHVDLPWRERKPRTEHAQRLAALIEQEGETLPPPVVESLEELAEAVEENGLGSEEVSDALDASGEALEDAEAGEPLEQPAHEIEEQTEEPGAEPTPPAPGQTPTPLPSPSPQQNRSAMSEPERQAQEEQQKAEEEESGGKQEEKQQDQQAKSGEQQSKQEGEQGQGQDQSAEGQQGQGKKKAVAEPNGQTQSGSRPGVAGKAPLDRGYDLYNRHRHSHRNKTSETLCRVFRTV